MNVHQTKPDTVFAIYHLWRGGLNDPETLGRLVGDESLDEESLCDAVTYAESYLRGPVPIVERVRCSYCGEQLTAVPCAICQADRPAYHLPEPREPAPLCPTSDRET